jgi:hypothetical protein
MRDRSGSLLAVQAALAVAAVVVATWNLFERSQVGWAQEC